MFFSFSHNARQRIAVCLRPTLEQRIHLTLKVANKTDTNPTKQSGRKIYRVLGCVFFICLKSYPHPKNSVD